MTDQTPVTDDDRRTAYEWCDSPARQATEALAPIIRAIRAHVPAPPATLADELRALDGAPWEMDFSDLADRVEAVEKHNEEVVGIVDDLTEQRDEARAEVERLTAEREVLNTINDHYDRYAVQERAESNAEISAETPNPADVKPGEAWLVECRGE
ncbi:hypothetical protein, partial [Corynebacterium glyciniphilum]|uniref:hypothetical protein n=1 Tax=Corynebacterium glyciniphilum TaxID=1404244 RepID=UPI0026509D6F